MTRACAIRSMASFSARERPPSLSRTWTILFLSPAARRALPAPDEALPAVHAVGRLAAPPSRVLGLAAGPLGKPGVHHLAAIGAAAHGGVLAPVVHVPAGARRCDRRSPPPRDLGAPKRPRSSRRPGTASGAIEDMSRPSLRPNTRFSSDSRHMQRRCACHPPAMGHVFRAEMTCDCGRRWFAHQMEPTPCAYAKLRADTPLVEERPAAALMPQ